MVVCGLFQVIFGYLKVGSLFTLVPFSMLHGMLAAIGFIILLGQMHVLVGELPLTGVIVRSSANVDAGGQTRWSAVLHGSWVLLFIVMARALLSTISLTALASTLVVTGVKMLKFQEMMHTLRTNRMEA